MTDLLVPFTNSQSLTKLDSTFSLIRIEDRHPPRLPQRVAADATSFDTPF